MLLLYQKKSTQYSYTFPKPFFEHDDAHTHLAAIRAHCDAHHPDLLILNFDCVHAVSIPGSSFFFSRIKQYALKQSMRVRLVNLNKKMKITAFLLNLHQSFELDYSIHESPPEYPNRKK